MKTFEGVRKECLSAIGREKEKLLMEENYENEEDVRFKYGKLLSFEKKAEQMTMDEYVEIVIELSKKRYWEIDYEKL